MYKQFWDLLCNKRSQAATDPSPFPLSSFSFECMDSFQMYNQPVSLIRPVPFAQLRWTDVTIVKVQFVAAFVYITAGSLFYSQKQSFAKLTSLCNRSAARSKHQIKEDLMRYTTVQFFQMYLYLEQLLHCLRFKCWISVRNTLWAGIMSLTVKHVCC